MMHNVHQFDDQSVRKNEWLIQLAARGVRIFHSVFARQVMLRPR